MRRFPPWIIGAVVVISALNTWAISRRGSGEGRTPAQVAHGDAKGADGPTLLVTDGETARSGAVRPGDFGSGHFGLEAVTWRTWSDDRAAGHGTLRSNTCEPSCADANYESYPVDFVVSKAVTACGGRFFSTLSWSPTGAEGTAGSVDFMQPSYLELPSDAGPCE